MSAINDYEDDNDDEQVDVNNIELLSNLNERFKRLLEDDLDGVHLFVDRHFFQVMNSLEFDRFVERCANVNLLTTTFSATRLDRLSLFGDVSSSSSSSSSSSKLVVMIASYLWDYADAIKMLLSHHSFDECLVLSSMSELAHLSHPHPTLPSAQSSTSPSSSSTSASHHSATSPSPTSPNSTSSNSKSSSSSSVGNTHQSIYQRFQADFKESADCSSNDFSCTVRYFPACYTMLSPNYFVLPVQSSVFPPLYFTGLQQQLNQSSQSSLVSSSVKNDLKQHAGIQQDIHLTTHSLLSFMSDLKLGSASGEDLHIYPVGSFAGYLANEIHTVLSTVHKDQTEDYHPISLVLVDRYLDLVGPCSHSENALDRIFQTAMVHDTQMPDINISPLYNRQPYKYQQALNNKNQQQQQSTTSSSISNLITPLHRIFGTMNMQGDNDRIWVTLASKTLREAVVLLKRRVVDIVSHENINIDITSITSNAGGAMNPNGLIQLVELLKSHNLAFKYRDDIQALCAVIETLQCSHHQHWDNLLSLEKILLLSAGYSNNKSNDNDDDDDDDDDDEDEEESLLSQISEIINSPISSSDESKYSLREIISLCLFAFSLVGERSFSNDDQSKLINALQLRIENLEESEKNDEIYKELFSDIFDENEEEEDDDESGGNKSSEVKLRERLNLLLDIMEIVARSRKNLTEFTSLLRGGMSGSTYKSLMTQLVSAMLEQTESKEIKALERFNPSKLGSLLGFGWGRSKKLHRVVDTRKIIIYVLGGLTFSELKDLQDTIEKSQRTNKSLSQHQILLGGTNIATSTSIISGITNILTDKLQS
ncbi:Sec1-like family protein [Heterostelium album PN500]|uniref:Sec1-like family protein n=1 Tax=Heterostelium pallidum (strain ATCC 26659 / Pp 5 / PN500) TaxID=670386 RepID=D3BEH7_HETP5|nr:Sec1-like family protein [Heterostelium album PN500]EFA80308.1 Sec1-like family protein [Heterostelium album PN500]|eukprot:XP_020432428.1 Sec1-like family protein [Heterostelium album PN500]